MNPSTRSPEGPPLPPEALHDLAAALYGRAAMDEMRLRDLEFGQFLVERGLVAPAALEACLHNLDEFTPLRQLLIRRKILGATQVDEAWENMDVPTPTAENTLGNYRLIEKVGAGGMGDVWKAWDGSLRRHVALKFLRADDPPELARFRREAELSAKLAHPGIAAIHETAAAGGRHFLAMQYVEGTTLDRFPMPDRRLAAGLLRDAARAVDYAHKQGIVHRDLKPSNIMASPGGDGGFQAVVLDFGLARRLEGGARVTVSGSVVGTPAYMSPEQARGEKAGVRSDVYGLGATMYEVLTGRAPFEGTDVLDVLKKVDAEEPPAPRRLDRTIDRDLETILLKCLEKDPSRRYRSAGALADDLERWLEGEPILARGPSLAYRLRKRLAKRKTMAALVAIAVLLGGTAVIFGRRASSADARAIVELRKQTQTALLAVLEVRRSGRTERMKPFVERTEEACREAMALLPGNAEPHYRLGRMYRAVMDDDRALEEQNRAFEKESGYGPALYERAVLLAKQFRQRVNDLMRDALAVEGARLAGPEGLGHGGVVQVPDWRQLAQTDRRATQMMDRLANDLGKLESVGTDLSEGERLCARGLLAWARQDVQAVKLLSSAIAVSPDLEEAHEALAKHHHDSGDFEAAVRAWTTGHERDRGYVPHLMGRAAARLLWGQRKYARGEDPSDVWRMTIEDCTETLRRSPANADAHRWRGAARMSSGIYQASRGEDPSAIYREGLEDHDAAVVRAPGESEAWRGRGLARTLWGHSVERRGGDPSTHFQSALTDFDEALRRHEGNTDAWSARAAAGTSWGLYRAHRGEDPGPLYRRALEDYGQALRRDPNHVDAWKGRGTVRSNSGVHQASIGDDPTRACEEAIDDFSEALLRAPGSPETLIGRGGARVNLGLYLHACGRDPSAEYKAALEDFEQALKGNPEHTRAMRWRGNARANVGNHVRRRGEDPTPSYEQAIRDFSEALQRDPADSETWAARGRARRARGEYLKHRGKDPSAEYAAAVEDFDQALKRNPQNAQALHARGKTRANWGLYRAGRGDDPTVQYEGAIGDLSEALQRNPGDAETWTERGGARLNAGVHKMNRREDPSPELMAATEDLSEAMKRNPRHAQALLWRGKAQTNQGLHVGRSGADPSEIFRRAIEDMGEALKLNSSSSEAWYARGEVRVEAGVDREIRGQDPTRDYENAIGDLSEAIKRDAGDTDSWAVRGRARGCVGTYRMTRGSDPAADYRAAVADFDEALKRNSENGLAHLWLADVRANWGVYVRRTGGDPTDLYGKAIEDYGKALKPRPWSVEVLRGRGGTQVNMGAYLAGRGEDPSSACAGALRDLAGAVELDRRDVTVWRYQGNAYLTRARFKSSRREDAREDYRGALESFEETARLDRRFEAALRPAIAECRRNLENAPER